MNKILKAKNLKPYLLESFLTWCWENGHGPYIYITGSKEELYTVKDIVNNGTITLNLSGTAITRFSINDEYLEFHARFNLIDRHVIVPLKNIIGIYTSNLIGTKDYEELQWPEIAVANAELIPNTIIDVEPIPQVKKPFLSLVK